MTRRGFSLAEIMVAIGVLGIGLTMVACFFPVALYQHADTTTQHVAMQVAREAKDLILQLQPDPGDDLYGAYLGWPAKQPDMFHPGLETGAYNVVASGVPPLMPESVVPNPAFDEQVQYIWYPFARRTDPSNPLVGDLTSPGNVQYLVVVTRRLPGQEFIVDWTANSRAPFPSPLYFFPNTENNPGGLVANEDDPHELALSGLGIALANGAKLIDYVPPGSKLIGINTWATYTVMSEGGVVGTTLRLREALLAADHVIAVDDPAGAPFMIFPPAMSNGLPVSDKSPYVLSLYF